MWTQQEHQMFNDLVQRVTTLENKCDIQPYYSSHDDFYDPETITSVLNDKFPLLACPNEKGILFMNDYLVFAWYHETDGWVEYDRISR